MPQDAPLITIGIPFSYEDPAWFRLAIQSVFAQTRTDWELILIGDGPSSELVTIAQSIHDPRVQVRIHGQRQGVPTRLNEITALARGKYVIRMDADDVMQPDRVEKQVAVLETEESIDVVCSRAILIDQHGEPRGEFVLEGLPSTNESIFKNTSIIHPSTAFRTEWLKQHPYAVDMVKAQDKELWIRSGAPDGFHLIDEPLLQYRYSDRSNYAKQAKTAHFDRQILKKHGKDKLGRSRALWLFVRSYLKQGALATLYALHLESRLYKRKFSASESLTRFAKESQEGIRQVHIDGW